MSSGILPAPTAVQPTAPAFAHRCKRLRHRQNECRVCLDVCPEGAITLDPGPAVSDRCTRCGLCQTACPTEVFQDEVHSDQYLLDRIRSARGEDGGEAGKPLYMYCREALPPSRDAVAVPCLGSVTGAFLLGAVRLGANPLMLVRGNCGSCRLRAGEALFAKAKTAYAMLAPAVGLDSSAVKVEERQRGDRAFAARRSFLARVAGLESRVAGDWPAPGIEKGERSAQSAEEGAAATPGRKLLTQLLRDVSWSPESSLRHDAQVPWASIRIDQRDCATCGTCVNLCPTGAITRCIENDRLSHHFNSALCINCRLCEEACPQHVISFESEFDARELARDEPRAITDIRLHGCEICGEILPEREGRYCITCQRRGRVENHVPGTVAGL